MPTHLPITSSPSHKQQPTKQHKSSTVMHLSPLSMGTNSSSKLQPGNDGKSSQTLLFNEQASSQVVLTKSPVLPRHL